MSIYVRKLRECMDCGINIGERGSSSIRCIPCQKPVSRERDSKRYVARYEETKDQINKRRRKFYARNKELMKKRRKLYQSQNTKKVYESRKRYKSVEYRAKENRKHKEKRKNDPIWRAKRDKTTRENHAYQCKNLTDLYLTRLLVADKSLKREDITPELIDIKRKQMSLARSLKLKKI